MEQKNRGADFHLPGLFEFYDFYKVFLPLFYNHREYFYDWVNIASVYGAPQDCIWGGGRTSFGNTDINDVISLVNEFAISPRLTFSNSLLNQNHLKDKKCNKICETFYKNSQCNPKIKTGIIVHSDLLLQYLQNHFPAFYFISSTTKVLTEFEQFKAELNRKEFNFVVPDFRLNRDFKNLSSLCNKEKNKVEFLCNECCWVGCKERKSCYQNVSRKNLGEKVEHKCNAPGGNEGYTFSKAMENPTFISADDIKNIYLPMGFSNFKIEGRGLGSAILLEFLLYYLAKPEYHLKIREEVYLDSMLDLF